LWAGLAVRAAHFVMEAQAQEMIGIALDGELEYAHTFDDTQPDLSGLGLAPIQQEMN
jgi:hypothetical protein